MPSAWERERRTPSPLGALVVMLLLGAGCSGRSAQTPVEEIAVLKHDERTLIESIDGVEISRTLQSGVVDLSPGRHTIRMRRLIELSTGTRADLIAPRAYPIRIRNDAQGSAAYMSEGTCTLTFEARSGTQYVADTAGEPDADTWTGSVTGPEVDARCTAHDSYVDALVDRTRYLCCAMTFDGGVATDANYRYRGSAVSQLAAGTPVIVTASGRNRVWFRAGSQGDTYILYLEYGVAQTDADTYFNEILRETDPTSELQGVASSITDAVRAARLIPGMTREQAILARGYPPMHQTPDRSAAEWIYYESPGVCTYVTFADGVIKSIRKGPAP